MREDNRHLYGHLITLAEFRAAYCGGGGFCRGCGQYQACVPVKAKGMECPDCGKRRVFSGREFAQNGWIADISPGRFRTMAALLADLGLPETLPGANANSNGAQK